MHLIFFVLWLVSLQCIYHRMHSDISITLRYKSPEVGVSHIHASHKQVSSLNLQVSSKSQVTVMKIKQVKLSYCYYSSKSSRVMDKVKQVTAGFTSKDHTFNKMRLNYLLWKKKKTNCSFFEFFEFFECVVGKLCRESTTAPGQRRTPHGPTKERKEKKKQGERNWVGGWGAEYESEEEERVRWPETSPDKLQFTSKDHTFNKICLNDLLWKKKKIKRLFYKFFECVAEKLCSKM